MRDPQPDDLVRREVVETVTPGALLSDALLPERRNNFMVALVECVAGAWALRASVDDLHSLDGDYIEMTRKGDEIILTGEYSVKVPLVRNVAACFDFKPSSE